MERFTSLLSSRRFILTACGLVAVFSEELFKVKIDPVKTAEAVVLIGTLVFGISYKDTVTPKE